MKYVKKILKITGITLLSLMLFIGGYLGAAYVLSRMSTTQEVAAEEVPLYILTNGVHTDLVMPIRTAEIDWSEYIPFNHTTGNDTTAQLLAMGWGDKGFYLETPTWADLKASTAFKAAFGLSHAAVHATYYRNLQVGADCRKMMISHAQYARLVAYIRESFATGPDRLPVYIPTHANYGTNDAFYEAKGRYNVFHTCNTWANSGLKSCGQRACWWTIFDTGIFLQHPL